MEIKWYIALDLEHFKSKTPEEEEKKVNKAFERAQSAFFDKLIEEGVGCVTLDEEIK